MPVSQTSSNDVGRSVERQPKPSLVLSCSGLDPSGGAGIAADVVAISNRGGHCLPIITCQTIQNGQNYFGVQATSGRLIEQQLQRLTQWLKPDVIKIGLLPDRPTTERLMSCLKDINQTPILCDPILRAGYDDQPTGADDMAVVIRQLVVPHCYLLTPNADELRAIGQDDDLPTAAQNLLSLGCRNILLSSASQTADRLTHTLYRTDRPSRNFYTAYYPASYHGSGCALCATMAIECVEQPNLETAIEQALRVVDERIKRAWQLNPTIHFLSR